MSKIVHPFDITDISKQTSAQVQILLMELPEIIELILIECGIIDKKDRLGKFARQIATIAIVFPIVKTKKEQNQGGFLNKKFGHPSRQVKSSLHFVDLVFWQ
ncbi:MAG: hypothetical protein HF982_00410 [Desulfobacteraceae bacterium]|nr:hypothetical protein [Desulfobacteraceae bacterium]MBC2718064.1 hypothetical protein [Desulfobacteraceae bacterium]